MIFSTIRGIQKEKQITKKINIFVCFHAGGLRSQIYLTRSPHPYVDRQSFCLSCYSHYLLAGIHHTALLIPGHSVSISPFFLGTILISSTFFWPQVFVGDCHNWASKGATCPSVALIKLSPRQEAKRRRAQGTTRAEFLPAFSSC